MSNKKDMTRSEKFRAILHIALISYKAAPSSVIIQVFGAIIDAVFPIITIYFTSATTSSLARVIGGDTMASHDAIVYVLLATLFGVVGTVWTSISRYIEDLSRFKIGAKVSDSMYAHFLNLDFWRYDDKATIDSYDRSTEFGRFFPYLFGRVSEVLRYVIGFLTSFVAVFLLNWVFGLMLFVAVVPSLLVQSKLTKARQKHWQKNIETRRTKSMIEWNLLQPKNIIELRINGVVRFLLDLRNKLRDKDEKERIEFERSYILKRLGASILESVVELGILLISIQQIVLGHLEVGQFLYVQQLVSRTFGASSALVNTISSIEEDMANIYEYEIFMNLPEYNRSDRRIISSPPSRIEFKDVTFRYPNAAENTLSDINLTIIKGEHIAIVGENGAGKSTFIKLLTGLYLPTSGSIGLDGVSIEDIKVGSWHKMIGLLNQDYLEYSFATAKDNIYFGDVSRPFDKKRFDEALRMAEAKDFVDKLPKKEATYLYAWMEDADGQKGMNISGGQWQRLALARNFYRDSKIIILDEPTSAIDALAESRIFKHLLEKNDSTIVTVSHRLSTAKRADRIIMMENGHIVEDGTHKELVALKGAYFRLFESQL